jgi:DNA repair exonuclease SbcCD nuclease subunit
MKNLTLFSDNHLWLQRQAHTTPDSAVRLRTALFDVSMKVVNESKHPVLCAGDLFDRSFNPEAGIVQGMQVGSRCWAVLSGNHDETNREGTVTSLMALAEAGVPVIRSKDLSAPYFEHHDSIYLVPHHASQELFLRAVAQAAAHAAETRDGLASYLVLHCNYDFTLAIEDDSLNLPAHVGEQLLEAFDFIFIGHEHIPSTHQGGRIVMLGNTHPTSFHDISDKFVYDLELETATLTKRMIWSKDEGYLSLKVNSELPDLSKVQFIDVTGTPADATVVEISEYIKTIWKAAPHMLAVRNCIQPEDSLGGVDDVVEDVGLEHLPERIKRDLAGTELEEIFTEVLNGVTK